MRNRLAALAAFPPRPVPADDTLRPANRENALFAITRALNTKHGHEISARIAAEVVLAAIERQGMVFMQKPSLPSRAWRRS